MSIQSQLNRVANNVSDTLSAINEMGGTLPANATSDDMAAGVRSITTGAAIDDATVSTTKTYSSSKIEARFAEIGTQEEIVQQVIAALGTPVFGTVDENKHITLSGHLANGTYTLRFEDTDGFTSDVCTIEKGGAEPYEYINQIPISTASDGSIYNGSGYKNGIRLNSSAVETSAEQMGVTGFIPCKPNDVLYLSDIVTLNASLGNSGYGWNKIQFFDENKENIGQALFHDGSTSNPQIASEANRNAGYAVVNESGYLTKIVLALYDSASGTGLAAQSGYIDSTFRYIRISCGTISEKSIVTINEPIINDANYVSLNWRSGKLDSSTGELGTDPNGNYLYSDYFPIDADKTYTLNLTDCNGYAWPFYYDANGNFLSRGEQIVNVGNTNVKGSNYGVITTIEGATSFRLRAGVYYFGSGYDESLVLFKNGTKLILHKQ